MSNHPIGECVNCDVERMHNGNVAALALLIHREATVVSNTAQLSMKKAVEYLAASGLSIFHRMPDVLRESLMNSGLDDPVGAHALSHVMNTGELPDDVVLDPISETFTVKQKAALPSLPTHNDPPVKQPQEAKAGDTMSKQDNKTNLKDIGIERSGDKIIVPEHLTYAMAQAAIQLRMEEDDADVSINVVFDFSVPEGLFGLYQTLKEKYNFVSAVASRSMFGPVPPMFITLPTGPNSSEQVPWGDIRVPDIEGTLRPTFTMVDNSPRFTLNGRVKGKDKFKIDGIVAALKKHVAVSSIYKGQAIELRYTDPSDASSIDDYFPRFLPAENVDESELIFDSGLEALVATTLFTPIERSQECRDYNITLKRGILLEGPYGVGKTLTAAVTVNKCRENGWTYIHLKDITKLGHAFEFAKAYQPALIFGEDIDQVLDDPDERNEEVNNILNAIDGINSKRCEIIVVLTTNNVDNITQAMLRPGRIDTVIPIRPPTAEAVERLIRHFCKDRMEADQDLTEVGQQLAGHIPSVIREVTDRARLSAVRRGSQKISAEDISIMAHSMTAHMELLKPKEQDTRSDLEKAAAITAAATLEAARVTTGASKSHGTQASSNGSKGSGVRTSVDVGQG